MRLTVTRAALIRVFILLTVLVIVIPQAGAAQDPPSGLPEDIGEGFAQADIEVCSPDPGGSSRGFIGEPGLVCLMRSPLDPALPTEVLLTPLDATGPIFAVEGIESSLGQVIEPQTPEPVFYVVFVTRDDYVTIFFQRSADAAGFDGQRFVVELAQRIAEQTEPREGTPDSDPDEAPADPSPEPSGDVGVERWLVNPAPYESVGTIVRDVHLSEGALTGSGSLVSAFTTDTESVLQLFDHPSGVVVGVAVFEYRFELFAAAALGDDGGLQADDELRLGSFARDGMVQVREPETSNIGVAFRQGRTLFLLQTAGRDAGEALPVLGPLAAAHFDAGPGGDTSAYSFPSAFTAGWQTLLLTGAVGGAVVVARALQGGRRSAGSRPAATAGAISIDAAAARVRRRGRVLALVQFASVGLLLVASSVLRGAASIAVGAVAVIVGFAATAVVRRLDRGHAPPQSGRLAIRGMLVGLAAIVVMLTGLAVVVYGTRVGLFSPTLGHLRRSDDLGIAPTRLALGIVAIGVLVVVLGAPIYRAARRLSRATAVQLRERDTRGEILYLRSFGDDRLTVTSAISSRRPFLEALSLKAREPFEEAIAWQLSAHGPVVAVGQPQRSLASLGAAREHLDEATWRPQVHARMDGASAVVVLVSDTDGLSWEVEQLVERRLLAKTLFVTPPLPTEETTSRWARMARLLALPAQSDEMATAHARAIVARFSESAPAELLTSQRADECAYRAAIDHAIGSIAEHRDTGATR